MIEFDEVAEIAWVPFAVLAALAVWRLRPALLAGLAGRGGLPALGDSRTVAAGGWVVARMGPALRWLGGALRGHAASSGNRSFDTYRGDALRRLEDEQREFQAFLERLRKARDKSEFDAFMAERAR